MQQTSRTGFAGLPFLAALGAIIAALTSAMIIPAGADTLPEALADAYANNTELGSARAHLRAVDEQVPQALAGWRPTVTLNSSGGYQTFKTGTSHLLPAEFAYKQWDYGGNLQIKLPLYSGYGTVAAVERAEEAVRASRADLLGAEQAVLLSAATAYEDVLRARALLALDSEIERTLRSKLDEITRRMQAGQLTQTDIDQTASRVAAAAATRIGTEGDLTAADARFLAAVGRPAGSKLDAHDSPPGLPKNSADAIQLAALNNPAALASASRARSAEQAIAVARAALRPSLSLSASGGDDQGQSFPTVSTRQASISANLTVPLYQGGAAASQLREAVANASESKIQTQTALRDAVKDATATYAVWRAASDKLAEETVQVRIAETAYDGVRREAAVGAKSTFELLGQLQELFNARSNEVEARYAAAVDAYQLLVAIGRFTAADLRLQTTLYDPTENYNKVRNDASPLP